MAGKGTLGLLVGGIAGAVAGVAAGMLLAPRAGSESRAMAADAMNDAWDSAVDAYERGSRVVTDTVGSVRPNVDATSDELRAKVDLARERMDKLRESLSETVATTTAQVQDAVSTVTEKVADMAAEQQAASQTAAEGVHVEVVDDAENGYVEVVDA